MSNSFTVKSTRRHRLHPAGLRAMHWLNALAMVLLIMSGWKIYNDEVLFGWLHFPDALTLGNQRAELRGGVRRVTHDEHLGRLGDGLGDLAVARARRKDAGLRDTCLTAVHQPGACRHRGFQPPCVGLA